MRRCLSCSGLVPVQAAACPNCTVTRSGRTLLAVVGFAAISSACQLPTPVYGLSCTAEQIDAGQCDAYCEIPLGDGGDPKKDPDNPCFIPDGGMP